MNAAQILHELAQPLDPRRVSKRTGAGSAKLSYLETHDVIDRLNAIFGYDGWETSTDTLTPVGPREAPVGYTATVTITARFSDTRTVRHSDVGWGTVRKMDCELGAKEAVSDALKRAARKFGPQFGNDLYDKDAPEHRGQMRQAPAAHSPGTACTEQQVAFYEQAREFAKAIGVPQVTGSISAGAPLWKLDKKLTTLAEMVAMFQGPVATDPIEDYGADAPPTLQERVTAEMQDRNHIDTRKVATAALAAEADADDEADPFGDDGEVTE